MSQEQLNSFLLKVKGDATLQMKLKDATCNNSVVAIAKDAGFSISVDDLNNVKTTISEEELEGVAGGGVFWTMLCFGSDTCGLMTTFYLKPHNIIKPLCKQWPFISHTTPKGSKTISNTCTIERS